MGGERGSTTRQRIAGKICCICRRLLTPKGKGESAIATLADRALPRLYAYEEFKGEWILNFSQGNRGVGRTRVIRSDESILTTVERGQGDRATAEEGLRMRRASLASRSPRNNTTS